MKTIFKMAMPLVLFLGLTSCNDRFEGDEITSTELAKIDSVNIAQDTMDVYTIQTIKTYSDYAANCEGFYGYDYVHKPSLQRDVATYKFKTTTACGETLARSSQINFRPVETGVYTFRFWTGRDSSGANTWLERMIVVE